MKTTDKTRPFLKKALLVFLSFSAVILISLSVLLYVFLKSAYLPEIAERIINSRVDKIIEIGSISFAGDSGIVIRSLTIKEGAKEEPFIVLPRIEITATLLMLFKKEISAVKITKPKLLLVQGEERKHETGLTIPELLFSIKKLFIEGGEISIENKNGKPFRISSINFSFEETADKKREISGNMLLEEFGLNVPFKAALDMDHLNIENAYLSSPLFGALGIKGGISSFLAGDSDRKLSVIVEKVPLNMLKAAVSTPSAGRTDNIDIKGYGRAEFSVMGDIESPLINGHLYLTGEEIKAGDIRVNSFDADIPLEYKMKTFTIKEASVYAESVTIRKKDIEYRLNNMKLFIPYVEYQNSAFKSASLKLESAGAFINGEDMGYFTEHGLSFDASFITDAPEGAVPHIAGNADLRITDGGFSSSDDTIAAEGINMKAHGTFVSSLPFTETEFDIHTEAAGFELLIGRFYGSFKERGVHASLKGLYKRDDDSVIIHRSELGISDIGNLLISGKIENLTATPQFDMEISLTKLSNSKAFDLFLRETFQESIPILSKLDVKGITSIELSASGNTGRFDLYGKLETSGMDIIERESGLYAEGVNINLPFEVSYPETPYSVQKKGGHFGSLKIQNISWGNLNIKDLNLFPAIQKNSLLFRDEISIPVVGGKVSFRGISYDDIFSPDRRLLFSMYIDGIDLEELSSALEIPSLSGSLSGSIPEASYAGKNFISKGKIILRLFGGEILIKNFSVADLLAPFPSIKTSVDIKDIDLGELTETFKFGNISGIVNGHINDLVITDGQAAGFSASIESTRRKGVKQWISVEALDKISILGSGSAASILNRGIYRLFKKYRYEKMGFSGSLRNDNFLLLGFDGKGSRQYLVKGGAIPPKVDVINYTQHVSFKEMIRRISRIEQIER